MDTLKGRKLASRAYASGINVVRYMTTPISALLFAYLIQHKSGISLWGGITDYVLWLSLTHLFVNWGMKEFTLRAISQSPGKISDIFTENFISRVPILGVGLLFLFVFYPFDHFPWLTLWLIGLYLYSSIEVLAIYHHKQGFFALTELGFALGMAAMILGQSSLTLDWLIRTFALFYFLKGLIGILYFRRFLTFTHLSIRLQLLVKSIPLFAMGLSGMLFSKVDLYIVNWKMDDASIGNYQIITTCLLYFQALTAFILMPWQRIIYRAKPALIRTLCWKNLGLGVLLTTLGLPIIFWFLSVFYQISPRIEVVIIALSYVLPIFFYLPIIHYLYARHLERQVLWVNIGGCAASALLSFWLIQAYGTTGALAAVGCCQLLCLFAYIYVFRRSTNDANIGSPIVSKR